MKLFKILFDIFSSFGFAVIMLIGLFALVMLGTFYQVEHGLFQAQARYFNSIYFMQSFGPISIPVPGAYLLMILFSINLITGGLVRIKKNWKRPGIIITHVGILVMLLSALITFKYSIRGNMTLYESPMAEATERYGDEILSYNEWAIEVGQPETGSTLFVITESEFGDLGSNNARTYYSEDLPFDVTVSGYLRNAEPREAGATAPPGARVVDGFYLRDVGPNSQVEREVAGAYVTLKDKASGAETEGILSGFSRAPFTAKGGGDDWVIEMARRRWAVPFTVYLDDFIVDFHPGTSMAANFESQVTKIEGDNREKIRIWMNHPLRHKGFTFFQANWGPPNAQPGDTLYTGFEVVKNPADQGPLVACIIVGIGLLIHFLQKLSKYAKAETKRRTA